MDPSSSRPNESPSRRRLLTVGLCLAIGALVLLASLVAGIHRWSPPPPEFADTTEGSGLFAPVHDWEPEHGEPEGLLDRMPPSGPALADADRNGLVDVFVPNPGYTDDDLQQTRDTRSKLFLNHGSTRTAEGFVEATSEAGIHVDDHAYAAAWGDVNDDGWPDLVVAGYGFVELFVNEQDGTFTEVSDELGIPQEGLVTDAAWGDWDADGDLDLYLARYTPVDGEQPDGDLEDVPGMSDALLRNDGDVLVDVTEELGLDAIERRSTTAAFVDAHHTGTLDLHVTAYGQPAAFWENQGDGTFAERAGDYGLALDDGATCQSWADVDRDTRLDLVVANADERARVLLQEDGGTFTDHGAQLGLQATSRVPTWGCGTFDYDNDGDVDLLFTRSNRTGQQAASPRLYTSNLNEDGELGYEDTTDEAGDNDPSLTGAQGTISDPRARSGLAIADLSLDREAATDVLTTTHRHDRVHVYRNIGWDGGWEGGNGEFLRVWLEGTQDNALGIGARVTVEAGDLELVRQVGAGTGSHAGAPLVFGLYKPFEAGYDAGRDVSVRVEWPSGDVDVHEDVWDPGDATRIVQDGGYRDDAVPPRLFLTLVDGEEGNPGWYTSAQVTLELAAQDEARGGSLPSGTSLLAYSLDGATWTQADPSDGVELTFQGPGSHELQVRVEDEAGNRASTVYPVRIDVTPPTGEMLDPAPGGVYAQGEHVATLPFLEDALVLAPRQLPGDEMSGLQPVRTAAEDDRSMRSVTYEAHRTDGRPTDGAGQASRSPDFLWHWPAHELAAGEYVLETTIEDEAGNQLVLEPHVLVSPTTYDGANATIQEGPSPPQPT